MNCNNCGNVVKLRAEFCPNCGQRVVLTMDDIIATSHDDAAYRHGEALNGKLRVGILALLVALSVVIGFIILYDKKLRFDGAALPGMPANAPLASGLADEAIEKPYVDPRPLPPLPPSTLRVLGHRRGTLRLQLREANGGGTRTYDTVLNNAYTWLSHYQDKDGGWPVSLISGNNVANNTGDFQWGRAGVTSLVLLAYFGDGHTWMSEPASNRSQYGEFIRRGVRFLVNSQDPETGRIGGKEGHFMYNHAMATLALSEASALTGDAELKARAARGVSFIVKAQTKRGGWDYYGHVDSEIDDISVTAWDVQALAAAREAGIAVPNETFDNARKFYIQLTKGERGIYNFQQDDGQFVPARSGMVLAMRQLLGDAPSNPDIKVLSSKLLASIPKIKADWGHGWNPKSKDAADRAKFDPYMMYFCTYGMFFMGGSDWAEWNVKASKVLFDMQDTDGAWRPNDAYSQQGGTCYATALCALSLQAHHRILHSVSNRNFANPSKEE